MAVRLFPVLLVFLLVAAACGGSDDESEDSFGSEIAAVETSTAGDEGAGGESGSGSTLSVDGATDSGDPNAEDGDGAEGESSTATGDEATSTSGDGSGSSTSAGDANGGTAGQGGQSGDTNDTSAAGNNSGGNNGTSATTAQGGTTRTTPTTRGTNTTEAGGPTTTTDAPATTRPPASSGGLLGVDWWGCWQARDSVTNGSTVSRLPNCASGPSSVGSAGDMFGSANPPVYRSSGAGGGPSIEFTHAGDTLLQTNGGRAWAGGDVLQSDQGVTMAWIGMMMDVESHEGKFLVAGQSRDNRFPFVRVRGRGQNRFEAYGGGNAEALSSNGSVRDNRLHGVIVYLAPGRSASVIELDGSETRGGQDSQLRRDIFGLTLGNSYDRNFSTTDHQFVFLGMKQGQMTAAEKSAFWSHLRSL